MNQKNLKSMNRCLLFLVAALTLTPLTGNIFGQATLPSANLQQLGFIAIPNWTPTTTSYDVPTFNRVTGVMYLADRNNFGATAIDTKKLKYIGTVELPGCRAAVAAQGAAACSPSGALVIPDLQKLVVTDRAAKIYIYDLRVPQQVPTILELTGTSFGSDELDYDPVTQRAYIGVTNAPPYGEAVVDVANNKLLGFIPFDNPPEQSRWNPVDGLIYVNNPSSNKLVEIDPYQGTFGAIVNALPVPTGCANAVDIDPVNDTAFLGCSSAPSMILDLHSGSTVQTFPQTFGADISQFNPHNRRFYSGYRQNTALSPCGKDTANRWAFLGVVSSSPAQFVGGTCTGLQGRIAGVDPVLSNIYAPVVQYPPNPDSTATGQSGIFVFHDPTPPFTGTSSPSTQQAASSANLVAAGGSNVTGTASFSLRRRNMNLDAGLKGLAPLSTSTWVVVETTVGHETIPCGVDASGTGYCNGYLMGEPLVGAPVNVASEGKRVATGTITLGVATTPFLSVEGTTAPKE